MVRRSIGKPIIPAEKITFESNSPQTLLKPAQAITEDFSANTKTDDASIWALCSTRTNGNNVHDSDAVLRLLIN